MRGGSWNNHRDNARCAVRNRNPPNHWNDSGFRVLLRRSHVLPHFFWLRRQAQRCDGTPVPLAFRKCRPIRASGFAGRGEGRRTAPDASGPRARRKAGRHRGSARAGQIAKHGHGLAKRPPCPPRPRPGAMPACSGATSRRSLPMPATLRLTCSYWPLLNQFSTRRTACSSNATRSRSRAGWQTISMPTRPGGFRSPNSTRRFMAGSSTCVTPIPGDCANTSSPRTRSSRRAAGEVSPAPLQSRMTGAPEP